MVRALAFTALIACASTAAPPPEPAKPSPPRDYWAEAQDAYAKANFVEAYALARNVPSNAPNAQAASEMGQQLQARVDKLQSRLIQKADDALLLGFANRAVTIFAELLARFPQTPERKAELEKKLQAAKDQLAKLHVEYEAKLRTAKESLARGDALDAYRAFARASDIADDQNFPWTFVEEQQLELAKSELPESKRASIVRHATARKKKRATSAAPKEEEAIIGSVDTFAAQEEKIVKMKGERELLERVRDYRKRGMVYESLVALEEAKRKYPDSTAVKLLIDELEDERERLVDEYLEVADRFFAKQDLEAALPYFQRVRKLEPDNIRANEAIKMYQNLEAIKKERSTDAAKR